MINLIHGDCLEAMKQYPDKHFDLAIVDPPYGIGANKMTLGNGKKKVYRGSADWDAAIPKREYWDQLFRVSKNQVVWGGNYMTEFLPPSMGWLFWDKGTGENDFADGELAWTSFSGALRKISKSWVGSNAKDECSRIHPTQKPIYLYKWILDRHAKPGDRILDTHLGSGSIAIACHDYGFDLTGYEIDADYYAAALKRFNNHAAQTNLFKTA
jgi:site-specific DNA-methyltransferase (adenine-specific)